MMAAQPRVKKSASWFLGIAETVGSIQGQYKVPLITTDNDSGIYQTSWHHTICVLVFDQKKAVYRIPDGKLATFYVPVVVQKLDPKVTGDVYVSATVSLEGVISHQRLRQVCTVRSDHSYHLNARRLDPIRKFMGWLRDRESEA